MTQPSPPFTPVPSLTPGSLIYSPKARQSSVIRKQIGQFEPDQVGIRVLDKRSEFIDPDPGSLRVRINLSVDYETGEGPVEPPILTGTEGDGVIERLDTGVYRSFLSPGLTNQLGIFEVTWHYRVRSQEFWYKDYYQVQEPMPIYSSLSDDEKGMVEQVSWLFGDLFDSTEGGPHLVEEFQSHYGFERIAQLMHIGLNRINYQKQPITSYTVGGGPTSGLQPSGSFGSPGSITAPSPIPTKWYGILVQATYIEVVKHLMRSYVEIPDKLGMNVPTISRRDYLQRWQVILEDAQTQLTEMFRFMKRDLLQLGGGGSLIVSGGLWGKGRFYGNTYSGQVRGARFYPASFAAGYGL